MINIILKYKVNIYLNMQSCIFEDMLNQFQNHINSKLSFLKASKLLIAISGGIDSVVLTHLCHKLRFKYCFSTL